MELRDALTQISEIRLQLARTEVFRGFRAMPVAFSGVLALATAGYQATWIPDPANALDDYLALWIGAAATSALAAPAEMAFRVRGLGSAWSRTGAWMAVGQLLPCLAAGALVTFVLVRYAPDTVWMLPGLWQIFFSLGVFASCRHLPRATFGVAVFYLACGLTCLALAQGDAAFSPWAMGIPFGAGQLLAAAVLYRALERSDD
jgi:hypothetical protein